MLKTVTNIIDASQIKTPITFVGDVTLSTGNLVIGTAGKGIDFSATTSGSGTMTSELLADYEEGTFTPVISGSTSAGSGTYTFQSGWYTKIGNRVIFNVTLGWSAHTGTGNILFSGLPFTSASASGLNYNPCTFLADGLTLTALNMLGGTINPNNTTISIQQCPTGGGSPALIPMDTVVSLLFISGQYFV